jgi:hypothetical protein
MNIALRESIASVLAPYSKPIDLDEIASKLVEAEGDLEKFGAVPLRSIHSCIDDAIRAEGESCPFLKSFPGFYMLREKAKPHQLLKASKARSTEPKIHEGQIGIVSCFGVSWQRNRVKWTPSPEILGCQFMASKPIDFGQQIGFYALHSEGGEVGYFGSTIDKPIGTCLFEHTQDRLRGRWNRFSFFGLLPVTDAGTFDRLPDDFKPADTLASLAAIIMELFSPRGNRLYFDWLSTLEFIEWDGRKNCAAFSEALDMETVVEENHSDGLTCPRRNQPLQPSAQPLVAVPVYTDQEICDQVRVSDQAACFGKII